MQVRSEMSNAFSNNEGITDNIVSVIDWCNYYEEVSVLTPDDADFGSPGADQTPSRRRMYSHLPCVASLGQEVSGASKTCVVF